MGKSNCGNQYLENIYIYKKKNLYDKVTRVLVAIVRVICCASDKNVMDVVNRCVAVPFFPGFRFIKLENIIQKKYISR